MLNVYVCKTCDTTHYGKEKPDQCEDCGAGLTQIEGVQVGTLEGDENELSGKARHDSGPKPFSIARGVRT